MTTDTKQTDSAPILDDLIRLDPMEEIDPFPVYASDFSPSWVSQYRRERSNAD